MVNKKHYFLDDKEWLKAQLQFKSMQELAEEYGIYAGSIRWKIKDWSEEEKKSIKQERRFHENLRAKYRKIK